MTQILMSGGRRRRRSPIRGRASALLAALLLVAACSSEGSSEGSTSTTAAQRRAPDQVVDPEVGTTVTTAGRTAADPRPPVPTSVRGTPAAPTDAITRGSPAVGQLAPFLLRPGNGDRIVVEVRAQDGAAPPRGAIDHVVRILAAASGKAVTVDGPDLVPGTAQEWDEASIAALADRSADFPQGGGQVVLRLLFLHGSFDGDGSILGASVRRDVAAIFTDQVGAAGGLFVDPAVVLEATTVHEVGHLLGLVDLVLGSGRGDPDHPGHSRNQGSVMFWAVESSSIAQVLGARIPTELDDDDRAELAAIRRG